MKKRIVKAIIVTVVIGTVGISLPNVYASVYDSYIANHHYGHYAPEYMDSNGALHDIDGDGDKYDWIWDCTECNGHHE